MRLIIPTEITDARLTSSTVPENDHPEWASGSTYNADDRVIVVSAHRIYEALQAVPSGQGSPETNPLDNDGNPYWLDVGPTNRWAAFDEKIGTQTTQNASIQWVLTPGVRINSLALINIVAASVTILVTSTSGGGTVYNQTFNLNNDTAVTDWYQYFFAPIIKLTRFTVNDIPNFSDSVITVTVNNGTSDASVGLLVIGEELRIGTTQSGMQPGIIDYSRRTTDAFGNVTIDRRASSRRLNANVVVDLSSLDYVFDSLESLRSTPVVWVASDKFTSGTVYGFYKDFAQEFTSNNQSFMTLQIEGLT